MLFCSSKTIVHPQDLIRLYLHEAERTYCDKLSDRDDVELFEKLARETLKKSFDVCSICFNAIEKKLLFDLVRHRSNTSTTIDFLSFY